ncbi:ABC transporter substrate-binding protein [Billgrantia sp. LNSP4103-1]|uniref:ABC transporter substrate-binding protein n=1 Tax=Billgrantia sp. LNSP4103-1 TaxID=3410266 RepID=UPI00403F4D6E
MAKLHCGSLACTLVGAIAASLLMLPLALLAESETEEAEPLPAPPLQLESRVEVFPIPSDIEALAPTEPAPVVEVPPSIEVPGVREIPSADASSDRDASVRSQRRGLEVPTVVSEPADPIVPPPTTRLRVTLDWYLNPQHATLLVAREKGMFARRGLDVTLEVPADPEVPAKLLAAGRTDLVVGRQAQLHMLVDRGLPLMRVATLISAPVAALIVREDTEHEGPVADLEGLRIGHTDIDGRDALLSSLLSEILGVSDALELVALQDVDFSVLDAMRGQSIDGVMVHHRYLFPRQLADEGILTRVLPVEAFGLPLHDGLILMANRDRLNGKRDAVRQLVSALEEAALWIANHPQDAWALLEASEPALADQASRESWSDIYPRLSLQPAAVDQGRYLRFERFLLQEGVIKTNTAVDRLAIDLGTAAP